MTTTATATVEYKATTTGAVDLHINGAVVRQTIPTVRSRKAAETLAALLNQAAELGAAHGPRDYQRELADALMDRNTPGLATYDLRPGGTVARFIDGREETIQVPTTVNLSRRCQLVHELTNAFEIGGETR